MKKATGVFMDSMITLGSTDILTTLVLLTHNYGTPFLLLISSTFHPRHVVLSVQTTPCKLFNVKELLLSGYDLIEAVFYKCYWMQFI